VLPQQVPIVSIEGNLLAADIVVMAVPASSLPSLVADYGSILQNKVRGLGKGSNVCISCLHVKPGG